MTTEETSTTTPEAAPPTQAPQENAPASEATNSNESAAVSNEPAAGGQDSPINGDASPEKAAPHGDAASTEAQAPKAKEGSTKSPDDQGKAAAAGEGAPAKKRRRRKKKGGGKGDQNSHERTPFHVGEEVFGKVTALMEHAIMVDLSGKALAIFDRNEMAADDLVPDVGDRFVAKVFGDGGRGGLVVLTRQPLREEEAKVKAEKAAKEGELVHALVTGVIKGGIEVIYEGLRAFAPASGVDLHPRTANFQNLVGQLLDFKITTYEKQGREVVVSRRPMLEKEAHERRKKARELLKEDSEMAGVVRTVVEWGAFVALTEAENLEGLVHASEVSHNPRERIGEVLKPGQKVQVKILKIDDKGKIWLSRKALVEDPFAKLIEGVKVGDVIEGDITRVEDFGAFVKITEGFEGLCHAADLAVERVNDAREVVKVGDKLKVVVHHIDAGQRRIALHPALSEEHAAEERQKVGRNAKLKVEVIKVDKPGLVVRVLGATGRQARGYIPAGQTGTPRGAELRKHFNVGAKLDTLIIDIDSRRGEVKLSISRLAQDEERRAHKEYRAKVKAEANFGTLGDLLKQKLGG